MWAIAENCDGPSGKAVTEQEREGMAIGMGLHYTGNSGKLLQPCNGTFQPFDNHRSYGGKSMRFSCNTCHNPGDGLMTGVWNVASDMETERENGPDQDGKMWQM